MLKAGGFNLKDISIKKDSIGWQTTRDDSTGDDVPQTALIFDVTVKNSTRVMQIPLNKGLNICFSSWRKHS